MKTTLSLAIIFVSLSAAFSQSFEAFNFTGSANANGWTTHSGTASQIQALTTPSNSGNSLSFPGLQASVGNRVQLTSGNTEDINKPVSNIIGVGYYSFLLNVPNTLGLHANSGAGDHFIGFGGSSGGSVFILAGRVFVKAGVTPNTFVIGLVNQSGTGSSTSYLPTEYPVGTTVFIVVKLDASVTPINASIWVNPTPGNIEIAANISNNTGSNILANFASIYIRQGGSASAGTGNIEIDEIRAGETWASVTPGSAASCVSYNTLNATACNTYTLNTQTYTTSGSYVQTLANANVSGCDSIINLNLTINNSSASTLNITNCGPFTLNNQLYTASDTYTQLTQNIAGCDSVITLNLNIVGSINYYEDLDNDGYGNLLATQVGCLPITGFVTNSTDCDDNNSAINPGAIDIPGNGVDEDCNGSDAPLVPLNLGMYEFAGTVDCDIQDNAVTTQPQDGTFSLFNGVGTNCAAGGGVFNRSGWNGLNNVDLNQYNEFTLIAGNCKKMNLDRVAFKFRPSGSAGSPVWHLRSSLNNYATDIDFGTGVNVNNAYLSDTVFLSNHSNLDQITFRIYITEMLGTTTTWRMDDVSLYGNFISVTPQIYFADTDADGFGNAAIDSLTCIQPLGYVLDSTDCDDNDSLINPTTIWFIDADLDGFGDPNNFTTSCLSPAGTVLNGDDCDDSNNLLNLATMYYVDADGDGFGDDATGVEQCVQPSNTITIGGDCDDADSTIYPGVSEICDGLDNNCNNNIDEGLNFVTYYTDADNDGYGTTTSSTLCENPGAGFCTNNEDCNDNNALINPSASEILDNGIDENCDGVDGILSTVTLDIVNFHLMPNPSSDFVTLVYDNLLASGTIKIQDINGKVLFERPLTGQSSLEIDLAFVERGVYIVVLTTPQGSVAKRLLKN